MSTLLLRLASLVSIVPDVLSPRSTNTHGDLAPENVDALVLYGKALLGSAIAQSAVLGGAAPQDNPSGAPLLRLVPSPARLVQSR